MTRETMGDVVEQIAAFVEEWNGSTRDGDTSCIAEEIRNRFAYPDPEHEASRPAPSEASGDVVEAAAMRVGRALHGEDFDPFLQPETYEFCQKLASAALATPAPQADTLRELLIEARDALETFGKQETLEQLYEDDDEWAKFRFLVKDYKRAGQALSRIDAHLNESQTDAD